MRLYHLLTSLIAMTVIVTGCGQLYPSTLRPTPRPGCQDRQDSAPLRTPHQPVATEETFPQPSLTPLPSNIVPTEPVQAANIWVEYRDARYGYAIALPCYWKYIPTPMEGMFGTMTARSYSDEFFEAHSERGDWKNNIWPTGALKLDVLVIEGIDPALKLTDAVNQFYAEYATEQEISSLEEVTIGTHPALLATVIGGLSGAETVRIIYVRLAPDKLLSFLFYPNTTLDSPDAQAILNSFVLPSEGNITLPLVAPSGRPDDGSLSCS